MKIIDMRIRDGGPNLQHQSIQEQTINAIIPAIQRETRHCNGEFPLSDTPSIVLHLLTSCDFDPRDLAILEATCSFFRRPAQFGPDVDLNLPELAALDMCEMGVIFKPMSEEAKQELRRICGGSWKLVLKFLKAGELCYRRGRSQALAGPGHSVVVTSKGVVYTFGANGVAQLGNGTFKANWKPRPLRSLQGIRIIQAAVGGGRTMVVSDTGRVYAFGKAVFEECQIGNVRLIATPHLVESLKNIFVVQVTMTFHFTAVLSREGRVYTFSWGKDGRFCHQSDRNDVEPRPLLGALENVPVVQISAGFCYLLALALHPTGMSVYSVGCGLGGKLGHGSREDEKYPRLIEQFQHLKLEPIVISAGSWHAAVVGRDGRVCTWGWGRHGGLGHGTEECELVPRVVDDLSTVKAVHVCAGDYTTFVISDDGALYSFGCGESDSLGQMRVFQDGLWFQTNVMLPERVKALNNERVVSVNTTSSIYWSSHTFAITESGKLYAFGAGQKGELGFKLREEQFHRVPFGVVDIDLQ